MKRTRAVLSDTLRRLIPVSLLTVAFVGASPSAAHAAGGTSAGTSTGSFAAINLDLGIPLQLIVELWTAIVHYLEQASIAALQFVLTEVTTSSTPVVNGNASAGDWFGLQYQMMMNVGWWLMLPLIFCMIIQSISKGSMQLLLRSILLYLPMSIVGTIVATQFIQLLIGIVDDFCAVFVNLSANDLKAYGDRATAASLSTPSGTDLGGGYILSALTALTLMAFSLFLWIVFVLRDASVYLVVMFMPVGFAMMVWPIAGRYFRKMVEFLVGIILSKLVMMVIISLSLAAFASTPGLSTQNATSLTPTGGVVTPGSPVIDTTGGGGAVKVTPDGQFNGQQKLATQLAAITMVFLAMLSAPMTVKLVGNMGLGEMAAQMADTLNTQSWLYQYIGMERQTRLWFSNPKALWDLRHGTKDREGTKAQRRRLRETSWEDQVLSRDGFGRDPRTGSYEISDERLDELGIDRESDMAYFLRDMTGSSDANKVRFGLTVAAMNPEDIPDLATLRDVASQYDRRDEGGHFGVMVPRADGTAIYIQDLNDRQTGMHNRDVDPVLIKRDLDNELHRQMATYGEMRGVEIKSNVEWVRDQYGRQVGRNRREEAMARHISRAMRQTNAKNGTKAVDYHTG